jgi:glycosyltransferase involved in cell wall biosynthesis
VAIWEDNPRGHRLGYVKVLTRSLFRKTGISPVLIMPMEVIRSREYEVFLSSWKGKYFKLVPVGQKTAIGLLSMAARLWNVLRAAQKEGAGRLLIATADEPAKILGLGYLLGIQPGVEIRCGLLNLGIAYPQRSLWTRMKDRLSLWIRRKAPARCFYYDYYGIDRLRKTHGIRLNPLPEPLLSIEPAYFRKKGRRSGPLRLGFLGGGGFGDRKGADMLLETFGQASLPPGTRLLMAGPFQDHRLLALMEAVGSKKPGSLEVVNGFLDSAEYSRALSQMDIVCLPYRRHVGPSAVFAQAASVGKVLLAPDHGWLGWAGRRYNKALLFRHGSPEDFIRVLEEAAARFENLSRIRGNFPAPSEEDFARVLSGT